MEEGLSRIVKSYCNLQAESFEFITRSVGMHNWLSEACSIFQDRPGLGANELYEAWRPAFERIFEQVFSPLFRPHRLMMASFPGLVNGSLPTFGKAADLEEMARSWERMFDSVLAPGEGQEFIFPKGFVLGLREAVSTYPRMVKLARTYEAMFKASWERSLKSLAIRIKQSPSACEFTAFFDVCRTVLAEEFNTLLKSREFAEAQTGLLEAVSDYVEAARKMMESQMTMFPALPFVTVSEMDALAKNVHSYKKRVDGLERRLREAEDSRGGNRMSAMERRLNALELQVAAMARHGEIGGAPAESDASGNGHKKAGRNASRR
ncbi:MAG: hypothetical protein HYY29_00355 [Chloroflexi bacterium]|nr:hypothetical protein [Chloroflexota bacterium]